MTREEAEGVALRLGDRARSREARALKMDLDDGFMGTPTVARAIAAERQAATDLRLAAHALRAFGPMLEALELRPETCERAGDLWRVNATHRRCADAYGSDDSLMFCGACLRNEKRSAALALARKETT